MQSLLKWNGPIEFEADWSKNRLHQARVWEPRTPALGDGSYYTNKSIYCQILFVIQAG
jgi:hypothetical protein